MRKAEARPRQHDHLGNAARGSGGGGGGGADRAGGVPSGAMEIPSGLILVSGWGSSCKESGRHGGGGRHHNKCLRKNFVL